MLSAGGHTGGELYWCLSSTSCSRHCSAQSSHRFTRAQSARAQQLSLETEKERESARAKERAREREKARESERARERESAELVR
jgi:hypothetical protein